MNEIILENIINGGTYRICYSNSKYEENTLFLLPNTNTYLESELNDTLLKLNEGTLIQSKFITSYFVCNPSNPFIIKANNISDALVKMEFNLSNMINLRNEQNNLIAGDYVEAVNMFKKFRLVCYNIYDKEDFALQQISMCGWESYYEYDNLNWREPK